MFMVFFVFLANTTKNCDDLLDKATLYYIHDSLIICSFFSNSCYETVFLVENWAWVAALEFVTCTCIKAFSLFLNNPSLSLIICLAKPAFDAPPPKKVYSKKSTFIQDRGSTYASLQTFFWWVCIKKICNVIKMLLCRLKTLSKQDSSTGAFLWILIGFERLLLDLAFLWRWGLMLIAQTDHSDHKKPAFVCSNSHTKNKFSTSCFFRK